MGHMKELDIRLRSGGNDAVAAFNEYVTIAGTVSAPRRRPGGLVVLVA
jgi:hypothetical protein